MVILIEVKNYLLGHVTLSLNFHQIIKKKITIE